MSHWLVSGLGGPTHQDYHQHHKVPSLPQKVYPTHAVTLTELTLLRLAATVQPREPSWTLQQVGPHTQQVNKQGPSTAMPACAYAAGANTPTVQLCYVLNWQQLPVQTPTLTPDTTCHLSRLCSPLAAEQAAATGQV